MKKFLIFILIISTSITVWFFYFSIHSPNIEARIRAVKRISNEEKLLRIYTHDKSIEVRNYAVMNMNNQDTLGRLALNDADVRFVATTNLEDQNVLEKLASSTEYEFWVRGCAIKKLNNQSVLNVIANNPDDVIDLRLEAIERIKHQDTLIEIATKDSLSIIRRYAAKKIENQTVLAKIAAEEIDHENAKLAFKKLDTATVFNELASEPIDDLKTILYKNSYKLSKAILNAASNHSSFPKDRIWGQLIGFIQLYSTPSLFSEYGRITDINIDYKIISETYYSQKFHTEGIKGKPMYKKGESIGITVKFSTNQTFEKTWEASFPMQVSTRFGYYPDSISEAKINYIDTLSWIKNQNLLGTIASDYANIDVVDEAISMLRVETILKQLTKHKNDSVREMANYRINFLSKTGKLTTVK